MTGRRDAGAEARGGLCCSPFEASTADPIKRPGDVLQAGSALTGVQVPRAVRGVARAQLPSVVAALTKSIVLHVQCERAARAPALHSGGLAEQKETGRRRRGRTRPPGWLFGAPAHGLIGLAPGGPESHTREHLGAWLGVQL